MPNGFTELVLIPREVKELVTVLGNWGRTAEAGILCKASLLGPGKLCSQGHLAIGGRGGEMGDRARVPLFYFSSSS